MFIWFLNCKTSLETTFIRLYRNTLIERKLILHKVNVERKKNKQKITLHTTNRLFLLYIQMHTTRLFPVRHFQIDAALEHQRYRMIVEF